jgi:predicted ATPase
MLRDPVGYPELSWLNEKYEKVRLYRDWSFGPKAALRKPQPTDMPSDSLQEDCSNLGLFLKQLRYKSPPAAQKIMERLRNLYDGIKDFDVSINGGTVQLYFTEGDYTIPATRLSDGTLRYLCLLAILCDPEPPPLVCIEEPELGLHPDILPGLADLMVEFSQRSQLIITTHSDVLVDAFTETPEAIIVCEKHAGQTEMNRLSADELAVWLEKYRLGELWTSGQLGGKRW